MATVMTRMGASPLKTLRYFLPLRTGEPWVQSCWQPPATKERGLVENEANTRGRQKSRGRTQSELGA